MAKKKIGILGGTFDPIHQIHLEMGKKAREQFDLDEVWLMPSGNPPHKKTAPITPGSLRLAMVELAVKDIRGLRASDYELKRSGPIYTADTLTQLSAEYPDVKWYFILGGDSLLYLDKWYHPEKILEQAVILAAIRSGESSVQLEEKAEELQNQFLGARIKFLEMKASPVSSTEVRQAVLQGRTAECKKWLPKEVYDYIRNLGLYRTKEARFRKLRERMQEFLPEKRYYHTLGVADTAACLAMRYGADIGSATLAGLLHDCAKYLPDEALLAGCKEAGLPISEAEEKAPHLLHGKLGAWYARERYGIEEEEILSAIRFHTTGRPAMTLLEQIIFVADYMEPNRKQVPGLSEVRQTAFRDIDEATRMILEGTLRYLQATDASIDPATEETLEYYKSKKQ